MCLSWRPQVCDGSFEYKPHQPRVLKKTSISFDVISFGWSPVSRSVANLACFSTYMASNIVLVSDIWLSGGFDPLLQNISGYSLLNFCLVELNYYPLNLRAVFFLKVYNRFVAVIWCALLARHLVHLLLKNVFGCALLNFTPNSAKQLPVESAYSIFLCV